MQGSMAMEQVHGGNVYTLARRIGCDPCDIIDMSSNMNPFGPPQGLAEFLKERLADIAMLPEADAYGIRRAFAGLHGIDPARVIAANGTTQIIFALPAALSVRRALVLVPAYSDYETACSVCGVDTLFLEASGNDGFAHSADRVIDCIREKAPDIVFICNPNNPTGVLTEKEELLGICRANPDVVFVIDESYLPFTGREHELSMMGSTGLSNLVVLTSMSKIFRIPGLRIGFAACPEKIAALLEQHIPCWSVNALAHAAAGWLMEHQDMADGFIAHTVETVGEERRFVSNSLQGSPDIHVFPSAACFMLLRLGHGMTSRGVYEALAANRILIRDCSNFRGLSNRYIRISLKTRKYNRMLVEKLCNL